MALKKGDVINPNGRPKGAKNKTAAQIREAFQLLISDNIDQLQSDLKEMPPDKRFAMIVKLSEFVLPKLQSLSIDNQIELEYKQLEALLNKAPEQAIEQITAKILTIKNIEQ